MQEEIAKLRQQKGKPYQKEIDKVLSKRSTGLRAKEAINLWLKINPWVRLPDGTKIRARAADKWLRGYIQELRLAQNNEFAASESGSLRHGLELLPEQMQFIRLFHPDIFDGTVAEQKSRFRKLMKALPEYTVMTKI